MALTLDGTNGIVSSGSITTQSSSGVIFSDSSALTAASSPFVLKNRIINGDMRIDQRNAGASVTPVDAQYTLDRWAAYLSQSSKYTIQQNAGSVTPPAGFNNYLGLTVGASANVTVGAADYFAIVQYIEGFNVADLDFGTANAKTVTLSFWVRSSVTGTFGGCVRNSAANRNYPFSYSISSANTWEQKSITIAGDTTGTWLKTNGIGLAVWFSVGTGSTYSDTAGAWTTKASVVSATGATNLISTNSATFYITGVQLEVGSTATPFERRMITTELQLCQRYYWKFTGPSYAGVCAGYSNGTTTGSFIIKYPVTMRSAPTFSTGGLSINNASGNFAVTSVASGYAGTDTAFTTITTASGLTVGQGCLMTINSAGTGYLDGTSEL